jgi:hypothetical protein
VISVSPAVKNDLLDSLRQSTLGNEFAHKPCLFRLLKSYHLITHFQIDRRSRGYSRGSAVINHLSIDMAQATEDIQTWTFWRSNHPFPDVDVPPISGSFSIYFWFHNLNTLGTTYVLVDLQLYDPECRGAVS